MEHLNEILKYTLEVLAILGITVEVIPIKFSPIKWVGNKLNGDIKKSVEELKEVVDNNDIDTIRYRISSFDNLCRLDKTHTQIQKHQYVTIFKYIDKWNNYHEKYTHLNGELKLAIKNIEECYKKAKFKDEE